MRFSFREACGFVVALSALGPCADHAAAGIITVDLTKAPMNKAGGFTSTGVYNLGDIYSIPGGFGVTFLLPPIPIDAPRGGDAGEFFKFLPTLNAAFPAPTKDNANGWTFSPAAADLPANSLVVTADQIHVIPPPAQRNAVNSYNGIEHPRTTSGKSGFAVLLQNAPAANTHWISVAVADYAKNGVPFVDNLGAASPYYDTKAAADAKDFLDSPLVGGKITQSHYFFADTYLASGPDPTVAGNKMATIYNGMIWGWADLALSVNNPRLLAQALDQDLSSTAALSAALGVDLSGVVNQSQLNTVEANLDQAVVPTPSGLCLLGIAGLTMIGFSRRWSTLLLGQHPIGCFPLLMRLCQVSLKRSIPCARLPWSIL